MFRATPATLEALELPAFLAVLADGCVTSAGRKRVQTLAAPEEREALDVRRARYEEARLLLVDGSLIAPLEGDLEGLLARLGDPRSMLEARDVLQAAELLELVQRATKRIVRAQCASLGERIAPLPDSRAWTARVAAVLDPRGQVRDDASPALAKLRKQVGRLRDSLYGQLADVVGKHGDHLSEETTPLHEGRVVLLLKSGARGQLDGLVHGRSGSGRSFYFEPLEAVEGNNKLRTAIDEELAERNRLLAELIDGLRELGPAVDLAAEIVAELDGLQAAARFAERVGGRLAETGEQGELRLVAARHPLLDPALAEARGRALGSIGHREPVVPLDLTLGGEAGRLLVITGPNAGGKTVALKTVGLLTTAHAYGLPVPADKGTRLPVPRNLVATVGDEQDLLRDRSTFSARLLRLAEAWEAAGDDALVLLDELGSGTDPDEGAALGTALLERLHAAGALTLATTHLTRVAALAVETEGATCAAMEFDPEAGRPTFRMLPGTPGASEAIALAERLEVPAEWVARAKERLDPEQRRLQRLLEEVERTRADLAVQLERAEEEARGLAEERSRVEEARAATERERKTVARRLKDELDAFKRKVRQELAGSEQRLWQRLKDGRRKGAAAAVADEVLAQAPENIVSEAEPAVAGPIVVGGPVRHRGLGWEGRLEKLARGKAEVSVRGKTMRCHEDDLVAVAAQTPAPAGPAAAVAKPPAPEAALELNLVGQRVEGALAQLDDFLDRALRSDLDEVRIIHGHGSGRLRAAVREHLGDHPAVAGYRPGGDGEGGDGATVATVAG